MTFITEDRDEALFFREMSKLSDRIVGLLAPVLIERRLLALIKSRWTDTKTRGGSVFSEIFNSSGELGSHDARLRIGLAMNLYSSAGFEEMRYVNKIRNTFAHDLGAHDFASQKISDLMQHLKLVDSFPAPASFSMTTSEGKTEEEALDGMWGVFIETSAIPDRNTARNRFLRSIEIFSILLYREITDPSKGTPRF